jgi:hypothetical protein
MAGNGRVRDVDEADLAHGAVGVDQRAAVLRGRDDFGDRLIGDVRVVPIVGECADTLEVALAGNPRQRLARRRGH